MRKGNTEEEDRLKMREGERRGSTEKYRRKAQKMREGGKRKNKKRE
jgi:hypothetical protein